MKSEMYMVSIGFQIYLTYRFLDLLYPKSILLLKKIEKKAFMVYTMIMHKKLLKYTLYFPILVVIIDDFVNIIEKDILINICLKSSSTKIMHFMFCQVIVCTIFLILNQISNILKGVKVGKIKNLELLIISVSTVLSLIVILYGNDCNSIYKLVYTFGSLIMSLLSLKLYDLFVIIAEEKKERLFEQTQRMSYQKQCMELEKIIDSFKIKQHDLKNHLLVLKEFLEYKECENAIKYLEELSGISYKKRDIVYTGNISIDGIINYKAFEAKEKGIHLLCDIQIPEHLTIPTYEMNAILANALDNAIRAVNSFEEKRIELQIRYSKGRLIIQVKNKYIDKICKNSKNEIVSNKINGQNHGFGLKSIERAVKSMGGVLVVKEIQNFFLLEVIIYRM